jgi:hypothetical protein
MGKTKQQKQTIAARVMEKTLSTFVVALASLAFVACSGQNFSSPGSATNNSGQSVVQQPQCEVDPVDYVISANIYDFEVTDKSGVNFGFNLLNNFVKAIGLSASLSSGKMNLSMQVTDPLHEATPLVNVTGSSTYKSNGFSGSINFGQIGLGGDYYSSTPLATMTEDGLTNALSSAMKKLAAVQLPWQTKIQVVVNPSTFVVGAGTLAGLKAGDQLALYNVNNIWKGAPCTSELLISQKTTSTPIAIAQVVQVSEVGATVQIISRNWNDTLDVGSVAEVYQLQGNNRVLNRAVRVGAVTSGLLPVTGGQAIDLSSYAREQIQAVIRNQNFYIHQ